MTTTSTRKVLVVDDELDICILLTRKLQRSGFDATYATSLREGLEQCERAQPDFLILDHNLPDGYGLEHINDFRRVNPNGRIIVISAMTHLYEAALAAGADHFTPKPISFKDIEDFMNR